MTSRERQLRIENHPDRWGGDHSRMENVFAALKTPRSSMRKILSCADCGVSISRGKRCMIHARARKPALIAAMPTINQLSILLALIVGVNCYAQRGTGSNPAATTTSTISMFALAPAPFKQTLLTWDNPPGASNIVSWGTVRNYWTNGSRTIASNTFPVTNGTAYKITAIVNGIESIPALWPSNRIGEIWLVGMGTNFTGGTNIQKLCSFTNQPPGHMQLWGVKNITTGWE